MKFEADKRRNIFYEKGKKKNISLFEGSSNSHKKWIPHISSQGY